MLMMLIQVVTLATFLFPIPLLGFDVVFLLALLTI